MKILFITRAYGPDKGGMERLSYELIQELSGRPDVQARVLAHRGGTATAPLFAISVIPQALALAWRADVVHLGDPVLSLAGWMVRLFTRTPVAVTVHGLDMTYRSRLYQLYLRLFFSGLDMLLPISRHASKLLTDRFPRLASRTYIINPGVRDTLHDSTINRDDLVALLKGKLNYDLRQQQHVLFTAGRLVKRKGHKWFVTHVLPHLPENTIYVIAGEGPEHDAIRAAAVWGSISDRVLLLDRVSREELQVLYNSVDAFVQPNIPVDHDSEGFGLVLLEAALCERPVFASNLEGISDAVDHGNSGALLPPESPDEWVAALTEFVQSPSTPSRARQFVLERCNWQVQGAKYLEALQSLVKK